MAAAVYLEQPEMSYRKQGVFLQTGDVLDPDLLNRALAAPAEEVAGHLNEHNFSSSTPFTTADQVDEVYWQIGYVVESVDPFIDTLMIPGPVIVLEPDVYQVADTYEWDRVGGCLVTMTTGEGIVQIEAWAQYGVYIDWQIAGFEQYYNVFNSGMQDPGAIIGEAHSSTLPRIQFAIRVDGVVVEQTITGVENVFDRAPRNIYPQDPGRGDDTTSMSIHTFRTDDTTSLNGPCNPVRLGFLVPVTQGSHTFELVVRRVPIHDGVLIDSNSFSGLFSTGWAPLYVFSRKILAIEHKQVASASGGNSTFGSPYFDIGDTLSAAALQDDRLYNVRDEVNDLAGGNLARGALRKEHLPSRILYPSQEFINSSASSSTVYPGYGSNTGWHAVVDSVAVELATRNGPYNFAANPCFVVVWATVYVKVIDCDPGFETQTHQAQFAIQTVYQDGSTGVQGEDIGFTSASNADTHPNLTDMYDEYSAIHLLAFFDFRETPPGKTINRFRVVSSVWDGGLGGNTSVTHYRGNIQLLCFRP